ncbi:putative TIM-barrel fold metal-dependent hydrolase [Catalinimonas alkaloidigena]|uniref:amidohydrolase family protein n=1 Tax=Catalinimonas alkaloidigena TaxID=1075417 RepID=UPI002405D880|nr:amidohydrolase family protein [Catalinimonas alkaloidigena]MDF9797575.1 putative TIM-barrel fold metal-dependent hydrolase [Catalinimonas alkaloidigena]
MKSIIKVFYLGLLISVPLFQSCSPTSEAVQGNEKTESEFYSLNDFQSVKKIDAHVHISMDSDTAILSQAAEDNFRLLTVNYYAASGIPIEEQQAFAVQQVNAFPERIAWATTFSLENFNEDGWHDEVISYLQDSFAKGAIAVKVWKNIGFFLKDKNGELVMIDNPRFDPILDFLADNNIPLIGHLGEHRNSWLPLEEMTVKGNRDYAAAHPDEHMYLHPERPSYEDYIAVRDHMLEKHPDLHFIGAHLGSLEWSVDELAKRLDKFPNMAVDMAERISHVQYQTLTEWQKVRDFFIKYQDRLIYATDLRSTAMDIVNNGITDPEGIKKHAHTVWLRHWKFFTTDEKMRVPKVDGEFKGLKLPREVVDKIYYHNAVKWFPEILNE